MKNLLVVSLFLCIALISSAQVNVELNIIHRAGGEAFQMNTAYEAPGGYPFKTSRLEYYVSGIELVHDGGQITPLPDTYLLVDAAESSSFGLGAHNITALEEVHFMIGVDTAVNHDDPALFPVGHALAPQMPSMHWGWAAGYRFVALEGVAGAGEYTMELHGLGDTNYDGVELATTGTLNDTTLTIDVYADYIQLLRDIDASDGVIEHSENAEARTVLRNMASDGIVFSITAPTAIEGPPTAVDASFYPNPAQAGTATTLQLAQPAAATMQLSVADEQGRMVHQSTVAAGTTGIELPTVASGMYLVQLRQQDTAVLTRKWLVTK